MSKGTKPVEILEECRDLMIKKGQDYQNPNSNVRQAMHYRRGVDSIHDLIQQKVYRAQSLLETAASGNAPNFESIEDTYKDIINYASFAVAYIRGGIDGQEPDRNMFNERVYKLSPGVSSVETDFSSPLVNPNAAIPDDIVGPPGSDWAKSIMKNPPLEWREEDIYEVLPKIVKEINEKAVEWREEDVPLKYGESI